MAIREPIIVRADDGPHIFQSVRDAELHIEHYDVLDGVYTEAYDATGRRLRLVIGNAPSRPVHVEPDEDEPTHATDVRRLLTEYLWYFGVPETELIGVENSALFDRALSCRRPYRPLREDIRRMLRASARAIARRPHRTSEPPHST